MCFSFTFLDFIVRVHRVSFNMYHLLTHDPTLGIAVFNGECLNCLIQYNTKTMSLSTSRSLASLALNNLGFSNDNIDLSCLVGSA